MAMKLEPYLHHNEEPKGPMLKSGCRVYAIDCKQLHIFLQQSL
jgi:hypothetical protein